MKSTIMNKETDEEKNDLQIINENNKKKLIFFNYPLFSIWSIGRPHCRTVRKGVNDYTRRVGHYCNIDWKIIPACKVKENSGVNEIICKECEIVLQNINPNDYVIVLQEDGKQTDSKEFAQIIQERIYEKVRNVVFVIGGAYGLSNDVLKRANYQWSLTKLVLPHQLVRLILIEQLFRAFTIINKENYHHA